MKINGNAMNTLMHSLVRGVRGGRGEGRRGQGEDRGGGGQEGDKGRWGQEGKGVSHVKLVLKPTHT